MANQKKLSNAELATFFGQMAMLLDGGIYYREGIETMLKDTKSPSARACLEQIIAELTEHGQFDVALEKTGAFPEHVIRMIRLGLRAGDDKAICHSLADYYDRQEAISEGIKNAVTYPMIMIFMMLLVIIVLITKVLPIFNQVFTQLGSQMNAFSLSLMNFGSRLSSSSIVLVIILVVIIVAYIFFAGALFLSRTSPFTPSSAARAAARRPLAPAPIIIRSYIGILYKKYRPNVSPFGGAGLFFFTKSADGSTICPKRDGETK